MNYAHTTAAPVAGTTATTKPFKASKVKGTKDKAIGSVKAKVGHALHKPNTEIAGQMQHDLGQREIDAARAMKGKPPARSSKGYHTAAPVVHPVGAGAPVAGYAPPVAGYAPPAAGVAHTPGSTIVNVPLAVSVTPAATGHGTTFGHHTHTY